MVKSLILIWGLITTSVYADDIVIKKPIGYTGEGPEQIVIQDRNLWATSNDITSEDSYGYHFQRWNNHGFLFSETPTVVEEWLIWKDSYNHKWYNSTNWIYGDWLDRDVWLDEGSHYDGIWWWENDNASNNWGLDIILETQKNRQGPCDEGYHVPSAGEWSKIFEYWCINNPNKCNMSHMKLLNGLYRNSSDSSIWGNFSSVLKIPLAGLRVFKVGTRSNVRNDAYLRSSSSYGSYVRYLTLNNFNVDANHDHPRAAGFSIRCFKNYDADFFHSYNLNYTTLIIILISFLIGWSVGFCICHHHTKRRSKSQ